MCYFVSRFWRAENVGGAVLPLRGFDTCGIELERNWLMKMQHAWSFSSAVHYRVLDACPGNLPCPTAAPGDFSGKSLDEWGLDWSQWAIATGLGGQTLPGHRGWRQIPSAEFWRRRLCR